MSGRARHNRRSAGEFLSGVALSELAALGHPADALGAVALTRTRFSARRRQAESKLSFPAASLTRERLDAVLLAGAARAGATVRRGITVRSVANDGAGWQIAHSAGTMHADRVFLASGKCDLSDHRRGAGIHDTLVGLKRYATLSPAAAAALGTAVEVALFPGGYCGIQPVEDGRVNVCLVVERALLKANRGRTDETFDAVRRGSERAGDLLADARFDDARPVAVGRVPYGFVRTRADGVFHLGDQAAVIPSFCGEGMAIALASARLAADALLRGETADAYQIRMAQLTATRVRLAAGLSHLVCSGTAQGVFAAAAPVLPPVLARLAKLTRIPAHAPARFSSPTPA